MLASLTPWRLAQEPVMLYTNNFDMVVDELQELALRTQEAVTRVKTILFRKLFRE